MKKLITLLFVFTIILSSCSKNDWEETTNFRFSTNSTIAVPEKSDLFVVTLDTGSNLVFEYSHFLVNSDPSLADGGKWEKIFFEIDPLTTDFSLSDAKLESIKPYYEWGCPECPEAESEEITRREISGTKIDQSMWYIEINVQEPITKQISGNSILN